MQTVYTKIRSSSMSKQISVVLAVHNEAPNIARCLDSVKAFADEIVVVDGESSDDTVKIAKQYGAKVISTTNKKNFHINKQMAMDAATGKLVLQLDADEVVDAELADFIQKTAQLTPTPDQPVAWWIRRKNWFIKRFLLKGGQYPDPVIRLYFKGKAHLPQKDVHEQMVVEGAIGWAEGHLLHYSNPTMQSYVHKFETYTSFKAQQLYDAQVPVNVLTGFQYLIWKPISTFVWMYGRHKGFMDGVEGMLFAMGSGWHHAIAFLKLWEKYQQHKG